LCMRSLEPDRGVWGDQQLPVSILGPNLYLRPN